MTERQARYLRYLTGELDEQFDPTLTKAEASKRIAELEERVDALPMSERQTRTLEWLCADAGEEMDWGLTRREARDRIEELLRKTGRRPA